MTKIRKLYYFDKKNTKEMISFLNNGETYINRIMFNPLSPLHHLLPLRFKFIPESYILKDKKNMKGLITIAPTKNPLQQMEIQDLLFEENSYEDAGELIQYVVSKYKAMGTASIMVKIDDHLPELLKLFVQKCGFSQISYEKLWKVEYCEKYCYSPDKNKSDNKKFREFRNSEAVLAANMYNEQLLPHFRPLLGKNVKEFKDLFFSGLSYFSEYKYVYFDKTSKNILAFLFIRTTDNKNFILDIMQTSWEEINIDDIIAFCYTKIKKRTKDAILYIKSKKYTHQGEIYESMFNEHKFNCISNHIILTNSSARIIKEEADIKRFTVLSQLYGGIGAVNKSC